MKYGLFLILASAAVLLVFGLWPQLDLVSSALFWDGTGFPLEQNPANVALRWVLRVTPFLPVLAGIIILAGARWLPDAVFRLTRRDWGVIVLTFLAGPGLLVNRGFKAFWGRARPRNVTEFGGEKIFTPPHVWTDQCAANCSFVSGEVSAVTAFSVALVMLLAANRGRMGAGSYQTGIAVAILLPFLSAFQRISAGGHFLSDSILAVLFTLLVALIIQRIVAPKGR